MAVTIANMGQEIDDSICDKNRITISVILSSTDARKRRKAKCKPLQTIVQVKPVLYSSRSEARLSFVSVLIELL